MKWLLLVITLLLPLGCLAEEINPPTISPDLKSLAAVSEYLKVIPDVKGKEFVLANTNPNSPFIEEAYGWRDKTGNVTFLDGKVLPIKKFKKVDFLEEAKLAKERSSYGSDPFGISFTAVNRHLAKAQAAIWLHQLGKEKLAIECWKAVDAEIIELRKDEKYKDFNDWELLLELLGGYSPWGQFEGAC